MKGIIFNVVEEAVCALHSADVWDDLLDAAELDGAFTSLGTYDDGQLVALVAAAAEATGASVPEVLRVVGRAAFAGLAKRNPEFVEGVDYWSFLSRLDGVIHPEVMKLYPGAMVPRFDVLAAGDRYLELRYRSPRRLWDLAAGLAEGAADHFGEPVEVSVIVGDADCADISVRGVAGEVLGSSTGTGSGD